MLLLGVSMVSVFPLRVKLRSMKCWFQSAVCVTDPRLLSVTLVMLAASGVSKSIVELWGAVSGALVMVGRGPRNRYPGE